MMVTKTIKFTVNIPNWLYRYRWTNVRGWLLFHLKPYRCNDCGTKMVFSWFDVWLERGKLPHRLGVSYSVSKMCICPKCILDRLNKVASAPLFDIYQERESYNIQKVCDVCDENKTSYRAIKMSDGIIDNIRFCTKGSWNGHYVCLDCVRTVLQYGQPSSSIYSSYKGKSVPLNNRGIPVVDGKVRFPDK